MALLAKLLAFGLGFVAVLIIVINILKGLIRGLKKTIGSLIAVVLAIVVSIILTVILCSPSSAMVSALVGVLGNLVGGELGELMGIGELTTTFSYYAAMLIGPFFFTVCYCLLAIIFSIVMAIVVKRIPLLNNLPKVAHRLGGVGVGLVCGYIVSVIVLMPVVGTLSVVTSLPYDDMMNSEEADGDEEEPIDVEYDTEYGEYVEDEENEDDMDEEMLDFIKDTNKYLNVFMNAGCGPVYNSFASAKFDGERIHLKDDLEVIMELVQIIADAGNTLDDSKLGDDHIDLIKDLVDHVEASPLLKNTVAGVFSTACSNWNDGEEFMGIGKVNTGSLMSPVTDELIDVLSTSSYDSIESDLDSMVEVFEVLVHSGILDKVEYDDMLVMLGEEGGVLDQLAVVLHKNSRMDGVADEVSMLSTRAMASHLNIDSEEYGVLMSDIATSLNKYGNMNEEDKRANVEQDLKAAFDDYGVKVEGQAFDDIVDDVMDEFDGRTDVTDDEISDYFQKHVIEEIEENEDEKEGFAA